MDKRMLALSRWQLYRWPLYSWQTFVMKHAELLPSEQGSSQLIPPWPDPPLFDSSLCLVQLFTRSTQSPSHQSNHLLVQLNHLDTSPSIYSFNLVTNPTIYSFNLVTKPTIDSFNLVTSPTIYSFNLVTKPTIDSFNLVTKSTIDSFNLVT